MNERVTVTTRFIGPDDSRGSNVEVRIINSPNQKVKTLVPFYHGWQHPHTGAIHELYPDARIEYIGEMGERLFYLVTPA